MIKFIPLGVKTFKQQIWKPAQKLKNPIFERFYSAEEYQTYVLDKMRPFLGSVLKIGGFVALGLIVASSIFGFQLGLLFSAVMVVFAAAAILYETSNILHRYGTHQYVAASLCLFASVMLLFWYILRLLMSLNNRR